MKITAFPSSDLQFQTPFQFRAGKVRDVYTFSDKYLLLIATDRISAFDVVFPQAIPGKGGLLHSIATHFLHATEHICPNWLLSTPTPRSAFGYQCQPIMVEVVVRGYLAGHALRLYQQGHRTICGVTLPNGLAPYQALPQPIITPTTKATEGHDEDVSVSQILDSKWVSEKDWQRIEKYALRLFSFGQEFAKSEGLILADTKYEFGYHQEDLMLMDEIHTPDSSRYFIAAEYFQAFKASQTPKQLSKEFVREWLIEQGFMGAPDQVPPVFPESFIAEVTDRYHQLHKELIGEPFDFLTLAQTDAELNKILEKELQEYLVELR